MARLDLWVIYDHPKDFPDKFVARKHVALGNGLTLPLDLYHVADTLEELRNALPPNLERVARTPYDDPVILEVWV